MEVVNTMEIKGEEREIADAVARERIDEINSNLSQLSYSENSINGNIVNGTNLIGTAVREGSYALADSVVVPSGSNTISTVYFTDGTKSILNFRFSDGSVSLPNPTTSDFTVSHVYFNSIHVGKIIKNIQLEIGATTKGELYYVSSNNKLTKEIHKLNESLADYGLNNLYDGLTRNGYYSGAGAFTSNNGAIANVNPYKCKAGDIITIKTDITRTDSRIVFLNSSGGAVSYVDNDFDKVSVPANATSFVFNFSPTNFNHIGVYINNAIDELKNDLSAYADGTKAVAKATTADSATKATQDGNGNDISNTYLRKTDSTNLLLPIGSMIMCNAEQISQYYGTWVDLGTTTIMCTTGTGEDIMDVTYTTHVFNRTA